MAKSKRPASQRPAGSSRRSGHPAGTPKPRPEAAAATPEPRERRSSAPPLVPLEGYLPPDGANYAQILRGSNYSPWQPFAGVVAGFGLFVIGTAAVTQLVTGVGWGLVGRNLTFEAFSAEALAYRNPVGMLAANLGLAMLVPISWLLMTLIHRVRPRWLSSVQPGIRWRYLGLCLLVAAVGTAAVQVVALGVSPPLTWGPQAGFLGFLVVILISSPLQALAEEVFFRGYLLQALGSVSAQPWFGVIASAVLFALLHGTQNLPLFLNRLAFGILAALLVLRTGGLEAGIAAHVINNVFAYILAGLTSSMATLKATQTVGWTESGFQILGFVVVAVLTYLLARRMRLRTTVDLSAEQARPASLRPGPAVQ